VIGLLIQEQELDVIRHLLQPTASIIMGEQEHEKEKIDFSIDLGIIRF
jgi:hypothetical protein